MCIHCSRLVVKNSAIKLGHLFFVRFFFNAEVLSMDQIHFSSIFVDFSKFCSIVVGVVNFEKLSQMAQNWGENEEINLGSIHYMITDLLCFPEPKNLIRLTGRSLCWRPRKMISNDEMIYNNANNCTIFHSLAYCTMCYQTISSVVSQTYSENSIQLVVFT